MAENIETLPKPGREDLNAPALQFLDIVGKGENQLSRKNIAPSDSSKQLPSKSEAQFLSIPPLDFEKYAPSTKSEQNAKGAEQIAKGADSHLLKAGPDGKIEISEKDFDLIGPRAKKALTDAGVSKISITPHEGYDSYQIEFKKPKEIEQDPSIDGTRKLKLGTELSFDLEHTNYGKLSISNIDGLTAESKILGKFRDAEVNKIEIEKTEDGTSKISSTGTWNNFSKTKVRSQAGEVFDTASLLIDRMQKLIDSSKK